ncbi:MAG: hypothetical protein AAGK78_17100 [Planctomycetota bacterium]
MARKSKSSYTVVRPHVRRPSWKRLLGLTGLRQRFARKTGIPTTSQGIERKVGRKLKGFLGGLFGVKK